MKRRLLAMLLSAMLVVGMIPVSAFAIGGEPEGATWYVSESGVDASDRGKTEETPLRTLSKAVEYALDNDTIVLLTDITASSCARITDKHLTITSAPGATYTISRDTDFATAQDGRSWYNPAMIEVTLANQSEASVTLENIVLDDMGNNTCIDSSGLHGGFYAQAANQPSSSSVDNRECVQDAIVAAYGIAENSARIILGNGAVLKNYGGMSAVRVTGGAQLTMKAGSKVFDDINVESRLKVKNTQAGETGAAGAVWVQGTNMEMQAGAIIEGMTGRAFYLDKGTATINGTIRNIAGNANLWQGSNGIAIHMRAGSEASVGGTIENVNPDLTDGRVVYAENSSFTLKANGSIRNCKNTGLTTQEGGLIYATVNKTGSESTGDLRYHDFETNGTITGCSALTSLIYVVNTYNPVIIGPQALISENKCRQLFYHNTAQNDLDIDGCVIDNECEFSVFNGNNNGARVTLHDGAKINHNKITATTSTGSVFNFGANRVIIMEDGSEVCDNTVANGSVISAKAEGNCFIMQGGTISGNTVDQGSLFSFASGSWLQCSKLEIINGTITNNTVPHNFVITTGEKKTPNISSYLLVPGNEFSEVYFEQDEKTVTVNANTKLGNANNKQAQYAHVPDISVGTDSRSVDNLNKAAATYCCSDAFATFWAQNSDGTPVTVKMDNEDAFDSAQSVYALIQETDEKGAPAAGAEVQILPAVVDMTGAIGFVLPGNENGYAVGLVQVDPSKVKGTLTLATDVTELMQGEKSYQIPYKVTFEPATATDTWTIESVEFKSSSLAGGTIQLGSDYTATWTGTLQEDDFVVGQSVDTVAILTVKIGSETIKIPSNSVSIKMIGGPVIITPADITVYTGGEGYTGVVDSTGNTTKTDNGLPEPGYFITLPNWINEMLGGKANAEDLSGKLVLTYDDGQGSEKEWQLELYGTAAHSTDVAGVEAARYIYRIVPGKGTGNIPVRLQLTDPDNSDQVISSDQFVPNSDEQYKAYDMHIYTDEVTADEVTAKITINGQTYTCKVDGTEGQLVVRGLTADNATTEIVQNETAVSGNNISAVAPADVTYYVNGSKVEVSDANGVKLLVDDVLSDGVLAEYIEENMADIPDGNYTYEEKYLDLVDTKNGNAYLTLGEGQEMTMYWPVPSDMNTSKDYYIVHFEALDRNYNDMDSALADKEPTTISEKNLVTVNDKQYIKFETGSFSPFVLVYEKTSGGGGGGGATTTYTITASTGTGGTIDPSGKVSVTSGSSKTFTIAAADGYEIADVLVDGKSVGAVSTYTFEKVNANHTISASFEKSLVVADPDDTGVSSWLNTKDHAQYLNGYPEGTFEPNNNMTRAEAAQMFYNLLLDQDVETSVTFSDVPADAWYAKAVNTLASLGMINGVGDNKYEPNRSITRAEFTAIAMRFAELPTGGENAFSDVTQNDWFYDVVVGSIQYGWITGYPDGTFRPNATITRAEVTTITNRMLGRSADEAYVDGHAADLRQFSDLSKTHWAYYDIMEATNAHDYTKADGAETWTALHQ